MLKEHCQDFGVMCTRGDTAALPPRTELCAVLQQRHFAHQDHVRQATNKTHHADSYANTCSFQFNRYLDISVHSLRFFIIFSEALSQL